MRNIPYQCLEEIVPIYSDHPVKEKNEFIFTIFDVLNDRYNYLAQLTGIII